MEMQFVERDTAEWHYMWGALAAHALNLGLEDPMAAEYGDEVWQYMGTSARDGALRHCFRHRNHPRTGRREYVYLAASGGRILRD